MLRSSVIRFAISKWRGWVASRILRCGEATGQDFNQLNRTINDEANQGKLLCTQGYAFSP